MIVPEMALVVVADVERIILAWTEDPEPRPVLLLPRSDAGVSRFLEVLDAALARRVVFPVAWCGYIPELTFSADPPAS